MASRAATPAATAAATRAPSPFLEAPIYSNPMEFRRPQVSYPNDAAWEEAIYQGLSAEERTVVRNNAPIMKAVRNAVGLGINTYASYQDEINSRLINYADGTGRYVYGAIPQLEDTTNLFNALVRQAEEMKALKQQLEAALAQHGASGSSLGARRPKMAEPPKFSGTNEKIKLNEWLGKLYLWFTNEGITGNTDRIARALTFLEGPAYKYMEPYIERIQNGIHPGQWNDFVEELKVVYGQRDDKEGAKKELEKLFANKDLASKNFVKFAEQFRTLGRLSGYNDALLIDKLRAVLDSSMRQVLVGVSLAGKLPTTWVEFLDVLMNVYKELHPDRAQGAIFGKSGGSGDTSVPMEVDTTEKKKGKKQANSVDSKGKYCAIHKSKSHSTEECKANPKSKDYRPDYKKNEKKEEKPRGKDSGRSSDGKKKKIRMIEVTDSEDSESEAEAPKPSSSKSKGKQREEANAVRVVPSTAHIEELPSEDDSSTQARGSQLTKDFWKRVL